MITTHFEHVNKLPFSISKFTVTSNLNSIYLIGGEDENGEIRREIWRSDILLSGKITPWKMVGLLPEPRCETAASFFSFKGQHYLSVVCGNTPTGSPSNQVFCFSVDPDGELTALPSSLRYPFPICGTQSIVYNDRLIVLGGYSPLFLSCSFVISVRLVDLLDGMNRWIWHRRLNRPIHNHRVLSYKDKFFLYGGGTATRSIAYQMNQTVFQAEDPINGLWTVWVDNLPPCDNRHGFVNKGFLEYIGGSSDGETYPCINLGIANQVSLNPLPQFKVQTNIELGEHSSVTHEDGVPFVITGNSSVLSYSLLKVGNTL